MDRQAAATPRAATPGTAAATHVACCRAPAPRSRETRAAVPLVRGGGQTRPRGRARQRSQPAPAMGFLLTIRSYLPELAPHSDAGHSSRLRHRSRADAPEADGPLAQVLEAGVECVPGLQRRARLAARVRKRASHLTPAGRCYGLSPRLKTRRTSKPNDGLFRIPVIL